MKYWRVPLDLDTIEVPHGDIHILVNQCKGCSFCVEYCPKDVLQMSTTFNRKGYHYPKVIKEKECVNCGLCEALCPDFAIFCLKGEPGPAAAWAVLPGEEAS